MKLKLDSSVPILAQSAPSGRIARLIEEITSDLRDAKTYTLSDSEVEEISFVPHRDDEIADRAVTRAISRANYLLERAGASYRINSIRYRLNGKNGTVAWKVAFPADKPVDTKSK